MVKETKEQRIIIQHYIPQCILSNFSNEKEQVYEGLVMEKRSYLTNIKNSMAERYTYEHSFIEVNTLEKFFSRIENYIGPSFRKIIEKLNDDGNDIKELNKIINKYIREYLIFYYRSGALLYEFGHDHKTPEDRVLLMLKKLVNSEYIYKLSETILKYYSFCIIKSNEGYFVVSDQFISTAALGIKNQFANVSNRQIGFKQVILLIPISKNYYAVYFQGKTPSYINANRINSLSEEQVKEINKIVVNNSYVKASGYNKDLLNFALNEFEFRSPVTVFAGYKSGITEGAVLKKEVFFYSEDEKAKEFFESTEWLKYEALNRNDECLCGSKKKFKKCHMNIYLTCKRMMDHIKSKSDSSYYTVSKDCIVELPINEWSGYTEKTSLKKSQFAIATETS